MKIVNFVRSSFLGFLLTQVSVAGEPLKVKGPVEGVRYVRIALPEEKKEALTLAEVEVRSGGKNIAPQGKAKQSSTAHGGEASRAIDGNKNARYHYDEKMGQSHTSHAAGSWWELDLGAVFTIDELQIWNRAENFSARLNGFKLELLDEKRKPLFTQRDTAAPEGSVLFQFANAGKKGKLLYQDHDGKANKPLPRLAQNKKQVVQVPANYRDPEPFRFQAGDRVAILGNGLADRMQHDGWMETLFQGELKGQKVSFRNMSMSGDLANDYPRSKGFTEMNDYLRHVKPDVLFCFFGYNESFGGEQKLGDYRHRLTKMVQSLREAKPNGKSFPRIVLFSPIAHENLGRASLPSGEKNNKNLALYAEETRKTAEALGVSYVDLFHPTKALYEAEEDALTINGVHLNTHGNAKLGEVMVEALLQKKVTSSAAMEKLRQAVIDKNWHWHNRYRATDGNDIWGGRAKLAYMEGLTNEKVLRHELVMLDAMTANRDEALWAQAEGRPYVLDDKNVPRAMPVLTNVGQRKDSDAKEGSADYQSAEETLKDLKVPEGFELNVFADEKRFPQLANPVQMQVDGKGRIWAASWNTYPKWEPLQEMNDALLIFSDDDQDGKADRCVEFARVHNPVGFEFWNGGVIVTCQPDILFLKDTDGDDVADVREVLLQGIGSADTHHAANNLIFGPDGAIYWQSGIYLHNNIEHPWGPALRTGASGLYRFDPRSYEITFHAGGYSPNPHGTCFDEWGYLYANDGTGGKSVQIRRDEKGNGFKAFPLVKREVRPVSSNAIISSENFPDELQGNFILTNVIGYLGVKNYKLHREGYAEKKQKFGEVWGTPAEDLLRSEDKNFRPTDLVFGQDGALYIADWHNMIIGHLQHHIRDPKRDKKHGRIYRMVNKKKPLQVPVKIDGEPIAKLLEHLQHPANGVKHRVRVELSERKTEEVIAALKSWLSQFDAKKKEDAAPLLQALWIYQQHHVRNEELLDELLASPEPHAVEAAKTVAQYWQVKKSEKATQVVVQHEHEKQKKVKVPAYLVEEEIELYKLGAKVFHREAHCATCHQKDGEGLGEIYPPINKSQWTNGDPERLIKLSLHGLWGEIEVRGKVYDPNKGVPPMTAFHAILDDTEMAAVLTYVRNSWENKAPAIYPQDVKTVRAATKDRNTFWKVDELLKLHPLKKAAD